MRAANMTYVHAFVACAVCATCDAINSVKCRTVYVVDRHVLYEVTYGLYSRSLWQCNT